MRRARVIPCLTVLEGDLVKTVGFRAPRYVGDPINAVKLFNEMEVDELIVLDIAASRNETSPSISLIEDFASEAFMPVAYGGGISSVDQAAAISAIGIEKIVVDSAVHRDPKLLSGLAARLGVSSTVASITVRRDQSGKPRVYDPGSRQLLSANLIEHVQRLAQLGAGEIMINDADRDGRYLGYDTDLVNMITSAVDIPVIACGGAGTVDHLAEGIAAGASAVAAGSMFMFYSRLRGVLINYPSEAQMAAIS